MNIRIGLALLAIGAAAVGGCGSDDDASGDAASKSSDDTTVVVGYVGGFTGILAPYDGGVIQGLKLKVEELNAGGKVKLDLQTRDSRSEPAEAVAAAQDLIAKGADVLITPCDSDPAIAAGGIAQKQGIPALSSCATTPTLPQAVGDHMFLSVQGDNAQSTVLANYATEQGYKSAYLLSSPDSGYTKELPRYFGEVFEANGGTIAGTDTFKLGGQDFNAQVTKIRQASPQPDVIMTSAYLPDFPVFIKQLRAAGVDIPVLGVNAIDTQTTLDASGDAAEGVVFTTHAFPRDGNGLATFYETFETETGKPAESIFPAIGWDVGTIIATAAEQAGSTDPDKLRDAIAALADVEVATGTVTYDPELRLPKKPEAIVEVKDGAFALVDEVPYPDNVPAP